MENGLENGKVPDIHRIKFCLPACRSNPHVAVCMSFQAPLVSDQLHSVLVGMIEDSQDQRLSLEQISAACQKHIGEVQEEVDQLVTYVLGTNLDVSGWLACSGTSWIDSN